MFFNDLNAPKEGSNHLTICKPSGSFGVWLKGHGLSGIRVGTGMILVKLFNFPGPCKVLGVNQSLSLH